MIELKRTCDAALITSVVTHPALWRSVSSDDSGPREEFRPSPTCWYVAAYDGTELLGVFRARPITSLLWDMHHCLLPVSWGRRARDAGKAFFAFLWDNTSAEQVIGFVPSSNALAVRYARGLGAREVGRLARAFLRAGQREDLILFTKEKP